MINIPADVEKYLVKDEIVDKKFELKDRSVFASANRLFVKQGNTVKDIGFAHISSIESRLQRKWTLIIVGIILIVGIFSLRQLDTPSWASSYPWTRLVYGGYGDHDWGGWIYYVTGVILIIIGSIRKTLSVKLSVTGLSEEQVFGGEKDTLDALFRLVNERRLQVGPDDIQTTTTQNTM